MLNRLQQNCRVFGVSRSRLHTFSKDSLPSVTLVAGLGVEGDAHAGETVRHRSRVKADPSQPNLRQVHLIPAELLDELRTKGFQVDPGSLGENVTTIGIDVLSLPRDTRLHIGPSAVVKVTGLRNPCKQLDAFQQGLTQAVLERTPSGELIRKCGIMGIVLSGGKIRPGDSITVVLPEGSHHKLERV
ncbi:MAG: MOSC domain-containing protein [Woeseia sp.]